MKSSVRAVLADDEKLMREQLRARLAPLWPELVWVAEARNGLEAVQACAEHRPDVVFLDIRMPGMTGIEAAQAISQLPSHDEADGWPGCEVVFVTAYDEYAVTAFEQGAVDYILKPAQSERLQRTVQRLKDRLSQSGQAEQLLPLHDPALRTLLQHLGQHAAGDSRPAEQLQWIQASSGNTVHMIPVEDILFFASDEKYTRVRTAKIEAFIRKPIKDLMLSLDSRQFWQIHRSTLVRVSAIESVHRGDDGRQKVKLKDCAETLEVSRSYQGLFKGM